MKIAMLHGPRDLRIEEQPLDTSSLRPNEIWVETRISALKIGTDRGNYEGAERVPGAPDYPRWVGDSNLGIVRGVGSAVTRVQVGDRIVTRQPHQSEYITTDDASMVEVPANVADEDAVFAHLYALSAHCYHKAHFKPGENVAVVGLGTLGLGAVAVGPLFGGRVVAIGNDAFRLDLARRMGAHATLLYNDPDLHAKLDEFTAGAGIDLVVLTANPWPAYRTAVEIVRPNGRVSIVSLLGRGEADLDFNPLVHAVLLHQGHLADRRLRAGRLSLSERHPQPVLGRRPLRRRPRGRPHALPDGRWPAGTEAADHPSLPLQRDGAGL